MNTLKDSSTLPLTPKFLYEQAKAFGRQCLPVRVRCADDVKFTLRNDCICYSQGGTVLDISVLQPQADTGYYMTVYDLYTRSRDKGLLLSPLRLCDAMAVSFYLTIGCIKHLKNEIVLDVTQLPAVEYDDLPENDLVVDWNL